MARIPSWEHPTHCRRKSGSCCRFSATGGESTPEIESSALVSRVAFAARVFRAVSIGWGDKLIIRAFYRAAF